MIWLSSHGLDLVSDGGKQYRRAIEFAEISGQIGAKIFAEKRYDAAIGNVRSDAFLE